MNKISEEVLRLFDPGGPSFFFFSKYKTTSVDYQFVCHRILK